MESPEALPIAFTQVQKSLTPFIRSRQEVCKIRQMLTAHLLAQISHKAEEPRVPKLSLVDSSVQVKSASSITGLRKEYLRSLRSNIEARRKYDSISGGNDSAPGNPAFHSAVSTGQCLDIDTSATDANDYLEGYITLVKLWQRHERLRILQDYISSLPTIPVPTEQTAINLPPLPHVPADIIANPKAGCQKSTKLDLNDLIRDLEKAVLRAKLKLKNERQALENAKTLRPGQDTATNTTFGGAKRLQALDRTRNELINWIEEELGKAGESVPQLINREQLQSTPEQDNFIDEQLALVKSQYARYVTTRKMFLDAVCNQIDLQVQAKADESMENEGESQEKEKLEPAIHAISPYLEDFLLISNEQKSLVQQRSHINVSLAKHYKETTQAFDRLAEESHLLSTFHDSASQSSFREQGLPDVSPDDSANGEMPSTYRRARTWTLAAESAGMATEDAVRNNVEEGKIAVQGARQVLSNLAELLGQRHRSLEPDHIDIDSKDIWMAETTSKRPVAKVNPPQKSWMTSGNVWGLLDGNLGVLKREDN